MSEWYEAEAHADKALEMFERGRWAEAESELRKALSLNPDQAEWHFNLGMTLEAAGRDAEALLCYERVAELVPEQAEPCIAAGALSNRLRQHESAIRWFDRAIGIAPDNDIAHAHKIDALTRLGDHDEAETVFYLAQQTQTEPSAHCLAAVAESLIERESYERARWCLKEALRLEPQMPRLRARLAAVLAATGRPRRAQQMYLRELRDDPGNIDTLLDYGELLMDLGRLPEAAEKFRRVLELEPANIDAHDRLGQVAMATGRYEQAHLEFELVYNLDLHFPMIRLALAEAMVRRGRLDGARETLGEELDAWRQDGYEGRGAEDLERFGDLLLATNRPVDAVEVFEHAVAERRDNAGFLRKLAIARFRSGDPDGGVAASRRVLRLDPKCVVSIHNLALASLKAGQIQVAAGWVARGLRVDRHDDGLRRLRMQLWLAWIRKKLRLP